MVLVFILLGILIFITIFVIINLLSTIKIQIKNLNLENNDFRNNKDIQEKYTLDRKVGIKIGIYFLNKIPIFIVKLKYSKIKKMFSKNRFKNFNFKKYKKNLKMKDILQELKKLQIKIKDLDLKIDLGTEDVLVTSYLISFIASAIGILLPHIIEEKNIKTCKYIINPKYEDKYELKLQFNCIIYVKIAHIISSILFLIKKGRDKNDRTSNRRTYAYSNE